MLTAFTTTLTPMLTMFFCILIGYLLNKKKLLPENADSALSKLEIYVLLPALNASTFMNYCTVESLRKYGKYLLFSLVLVIVAIIIAFLLSKLFATKDEYLNKIYRYTFAFSNFGFLGNAIVPMILGEEHLYTYLLFTMPATFFCFTWGVSTLIPKGKNQGNILKNLLNPSIIAIIVGIFLGITGINAFIPQFIKTSLSNLTGCMGPIAMVLTGFVTAKFNLVELLKKKTVYLVTFIRLVVIPLIFIFALYLLKADALIIKLCLFNYATACGLNTVVYPTAYGSDASTGASLALISHIFVVITIPLLYALTVVLTGA